MTTYRASTRVLLRRPLDHPVPLFPSPPQAPLPSQFILESSELQDLGEGEMPSQDESESRRLIPRSNSPEPDRSSRALEKKCELIDQEIDGNGMGRYQWCIWVLAGLGYLLDLLWSQAFGLVLGPVAQEFGVSGNESGDISVAFSIGLTCGALVWGVLVDIIGRRWAFNLTCLISAAFGLGLGACTTYASFLVVTACIGFGIGGNIPADTTICLEFIPQNRRVLLALLSIFQPIGVVIASVIAYVCIPRFSCSPNFSEKDPLPGCSKVGDGEACCAADVNMGWRYLMFTLGGITLAVFLARFVIFTLKETPKYLVHQGRDEEAIEVLQYIAKFNKQTCSLTIQDLDSVSDAYDTKPGGQTSTRGKVRAELARYRMLFSDRTTARLTILVWLTYMFDHWGFTLAGHYLPTIVAIKNGGLNRSLEHTYRNYITIYAPGIVGVGIGAFMYRAPRFGRRWTLVVSSGLMGASILIFSTVDTIDGNIGLNVMEYFFQSMFNAVLYGWTPQAFAAPIRGTACGLASFFGRTFSILAPLTAQSVIPKEGLKAGDPSINYVLYMAGGITMLCMITTYLIPEPKAGR